MRISDWSSDVCSSDLPDFLRLGALLGLMLERHPAVHTDLSYGVSGSVLAQIASAQLDVGFYLGLPTDKRLYATTLTSFHYCVAAPRDWRERVASDDWSQLVQLPWIWPPPESVHHRLLAERFAALGMTPQIAEIGRAHV